MSRLKLIIGIILASIGTALTYFVFEELIHSGINAIWHDWFNTNSQRWLIIPISLVLGLVFFGLQHTLDKPSEGHEEHGLGAMPKPTLRNYAKTLLIGLFSLWAGATLGPEAILVPASMILASYIGVRVIKSGKKESTLLVGAAIVALFTAFFHSFLIGLIAVLLVTKQAKTKLNGPILVMAIIASAVSYGTLWLVDGRALIHVSPDTWAINSATLLWLAPLAIAGFATTYAIKATHDVAEKIYKLAILKTWWLHAILASLGIAALYLLGGEYVQFTGNESINPMLEQASTLGIAALIWIAVIKIILIGWSKGIGYRGGLIFPLIFVLSAYCAVAQLINSDINVFYALIASLIGAIAANQKKRILF